MRECIIGKRILSITNVFIQIGQLYVISYLKRKSLFYERDDKPGLKFTPNTFVIPNFPSVEEGFI